MRRALAAVVLAAGALVGASMLPADAALPTITAAGDIATSGSGDSATAALVQNLNPTVALTLGDNAYADGTLTQFQNYYDPTWGAFKAKTEPIPGNHDWHSNLAGYRGYFGSGFENRSYNVSNWLMVAVDSGDGVTSADVSFLTQALEGEGSLSNCQIVYQHHPRWSSGQHGSDSNLQTEWSAIVNHGVELMLVGHDHLYERFAPKNASGQTVGRTVGTRSVTVGTGGAGLYPFTTVESGSQVRINDRFGVLKLTLRPDRYVGRFVATDGSVLDTFRGPCH